jgi:DNA integrity scanning protein DisA with diadenylate cyclase activity
MERFFSQQSIERYRKLLDRSAEESQRRLIFKWLAAQAHTMRTAATSELRVRVEQRGENYIWELHRDGHLQPVKFSAPVYLSEEAARASGADMRSLYLVRIAARRPRAKQYANATGVS